MTRRAAASLLAVALIGMLAGAAATGKPGADAGAVFQPPAAEGLHRPQVLPLGRDGGHLRVEVVVGMGGRPWPMLFDTGAPTIVPVELAEELGLATSGSLLVRAPGAAASRMDVVTVPELRMGAAAFFGVRAVVNRGSGASAGGLVGRGVIGADLMQTGVWQLDQRAGTLTIAEGVTAMDHVAGAIELAFAPASRTVPSPMVESDLAGGTHRFLVDTGSDSGLVLHPSDLAWQPIARQPRVLVDGWGGGRAASAGEVLVEARLGETPPVTLPLLLSDALDPGLGLMGNGFLADFVVTIDWPSRRLYLAPQSDPSG